MPKLASQCMMYQCDITNKNNEVCPQCFVRITRDFNSDHNSYQFNVWVKLPD
jgi:hypothetical protein